MFNRQVEANDPANQLISLGLDDLIKVWDMTNSKCLQTIDVSFVPGQPSVKKAPTELKVCAENI